MTISGGVPIPADFFSDVYLDFNKNGAYPDYASIKVPSLYSTSGMPYIKVRFNFRIFGSWNAQLLYNCMGPGFEGNTVAEDDAAKPRPFMTGAGNMYLTRFSYNKTLIGLGIQYEF